MCVCVCLCLCQVESGRAVHPLLQWHKHPHDYYSREAQVLYFSSLRTFWQELLDLGCPGDQPSVSEALVCAFKRLDNDISLEAQVSHAPSLWARRAQGWLFLADM